MNKTETIELIHLLIKTAVIYRRRAIASQIVGGVVENSCSRHFKGLCNLALADAHTEAFHAGLIN